MTGKVARKVLSRSGLPPAKLQDVLNLANTRKSGTLNQTEFIIAMHYIERSIKESIPLPSTLPASIYASAIGRSISSPLARQNTLQINKAPIQSPVFKGSSLSNVEIAPEEYARYKTFFNQLTTSNYVSGADAVVFFKHSNLPDSELARIWDLADTNSSGQLSEQEFAMAMHIINRRIAGGNIPDSLSELRAGRISQYIYEKQNLIIFLLAPEHNFHEHQQQQQHQQPVVDLLGLSNDFDDVFTPTTSQQTLPPQPQPQRPHPQQLQYHAELSRSQQALESNILNETSRSHQIQTQLQTEQRAVEELERQIQQQKEELEKIKKIADEAEKQLEVEKKKKERLMEELNMYRQETKHFKSRIENTQDEIQQLKKETDALEKPIMSSPVASSLSPKPNHQHDVFSLSSTTGGLFAKVHETPSSAAAAAVSPSSVHSMPPITSQKMFDPFAGFKSSQSHSATSSPTLNKLKAGSESRETVTPVDINEIESKFPDLNTMEQNFALPTSPPKPEHQPIKEETKPVQEIKPVQETKPVQEAKSSIQATKPMNNPVSKYGFDLSVFETPSTGTNDLFNNGGSMSVKDELSSIFGSPSTNVNTSTPTNPSVFDDVFGSNPSTNKNSNTTTTMPSFEDAFFKQ